MSEIKRKSNSNPSVKIGFMFIALGLLLGGIVAISQSPPDAVTGGWQTFNFHNDIGFTIVIPDQNNMSKKSNQERYGFFIFFIWTMDTRIAIAPTGVRYFMKTVMIEYRIDSIP